MHTKVMAAAAAILLLAAGAASAATIHFTATLKGADEVPPNTTAGMGSVSATLDTDTKALHYSATYSGLTGPATAAHFHGPAAPGADGPVAVAAKASPSPIEGMATLTDSQVSDLEAGKWYFNIHTAANPGGEIRGQVMTAP
jgi:hypothetical protein